MSAYTWWGCARDLTEDADLKRPSELFDEEESVFEPAQPLSVRVRGVMVREDEDWWFRKDNDIAIATHFQFSNEPPVQRLHFLQNESDLGWKEGFFRDVVFSVRDFKGELLNLRLQVYDLDGVSKEFISGVESVSKAAAVAFPVLAPYAGLVGLAGPALLRLVDHLDDHDEILSERLKLEVEHQNYGHKLLQPGYFVCFKKPVEEGFKLNSDLRVVDSNGKPYEEASYAVIEVDRDHVVDFKWEVDQKMAKLISELDGKGQSGKPAVTFLEDTLESYTVMRRLQRIRELQAKETRSNAEEKLLDELLADERLGDYLNPVPN